MRGTVDILKQNTQKLGQRGAHLDDLQDKTNNLAESASGFRRGANQVRKKMWWKVGEYSDILSTG